MNSTTTGRSSQEKRPTAHVAALLMLATAAVAAQEAVFRSRVDLVTVDASVVGRNGLPVTNLGTDDFVVEVDGRRRQLVSAQFVWQQRPETAIAPIPALHFSSNEDDQGRLLLIAVDEAHIRRLEGRSALRAAAAFIDTLDPLDRIAVNGLSRIGRIDFSRDRLAVKRRLEGLVGHTDPVFLQFNIGLAEALEIADGSRTRLADAVLRECGRALTDYLSQARAADDGGGRDACPEQVEQEARASAQHARTQARISLSAIDVLIATLKTIEGPKTIVLLSEGMVLDSRLVDLSDLAARAHDARVTLYALHLESPLFEASQDRVSPTLVRDFDFRGDGLARLAGATRGTMYRLVGQDPRPFRRIADELEGHYLLAFEAEPADRDGRLHKLGVRLNSGGTVVRARPAFRLPAVVPSPRSREQDLVLLLRTSQSVSDLPVRVSTYTYAEPDSTRLRVVVSAEADVPEGPGGDVLIGYVLVDSGGVIVASGAERASGRYAFSTVVEPGAYALRVAAIDPLDRRGLTVRPFAAALGRQAGVVVSDLILAPTPSRADAALTPFVDRISESGVSAYLELAPDDGAGEIDVTVEIEHESAKRIERRAPATVDRRSGRLAIARAQLVFEDLPAGRYVAHARIRVAGGSEGVVSRPFTYSPEGR